MSNYMSNFLLRAASTSRQKVQAASAEEVKKLDLAMQKLGFHPEHDSDLGSALTLTYMNKRVTLSLEWKGNQTLLRLDSDGGGYDLSSKVEDVRFHLQQTMTRLKEDGLKSDLPYYRKALEALVVLKPYLGKHL